MESDLIIYEISLLLWLVVAIVGLIFHKPSQPRKSRKNWEA